MAKLGISIRIDVSKIDKARLYKGEKGTYLDLTTMVDTGDADKYGNHGFISQSVSKDERQQGVKTPILGNVKVFWQEQSVPVQKQSAPAAPNAPDFDDDLPF